MGGGMTLGAVCNVYNDSLALAGWLENVTQFADVVTVIHSGPNGRASTDGTMELLERWGIKPIMSRIDFGFGVVRTQCIRECKADWAIITDADERFYQYVPILTCQGNEAYPEIRDPKLVVDHHPPEMFNQIALLRTLMAHDVLAVRASRRHWFDYTWKRPCQNWEIIPDWQLRIVKNDPRVGYDSVTKMHERCIDTTTNECPRFATEKQGDPRGIFIDHFHCFWKAQEPEQRKEDIKIYNALHEGCVDSMWITLGYK